MTTTEKSYPPRRRGQRITAPKNGAQHLMVVKHQRRLMASEALADQHGEAVWAAISVHDARRRLETFNRLAARDRDAGRPASIVLAERISTARAALAVAEAALATVRKAVKPRDVEVSDDE